MDAQTAELVATWRRDRGPGPAADALDALADAAEAAPGSVDPQLVDELGRDAEERHPEDAVVLVAAGRAYYAVGELNRALRVLVRAARLAFPPRAFRLLGEVLLRLGEAQRAVRALDRAIAGGLDDPDLPALRATAQAYALVQDTYGIERVALEVERALPRGVPRSSLSAAPPSRRPPATISTPPPASTPAPLSVSSRAMALHEADALVQSAVAPIDPDEERTRVMARPLESIVADAQSAARAEAEAMATPAPSAVSSVPIAPAPIAPAPMAPAPMAPAPIRPVASIASLAQTEAAPRRTPAPTPAASRAATPAPPTPIAPTLDPTPPPSSHPTSSGPVAVTSKAILPVALVEPSTSKVELPPPMLEPSVVPPSPAQRAPRSRSLGIYAGLAAIVAIALAARFVLVARSLADDRREPAAALAGPVEVAEGPATAQPAAAPSAAAPNGAAAAPSSAVATSEPASSAPVVATAKASASPAESAAAGSAAAKAKPVKPRRRRKLPAAPKPTPTAEAKAAAAQAADKGATEPKPPEPGAPAAEPPARDSKPASEPAPASS